MGEHAQPQKKKMSKTQTIHVSATFSHSVFRLFFICRLGGTALNYLLVWLILKAWAVSWHLQTILAWNLAKTVCHCIYGSYPNLYTPTKTARNLVLWLMSNLISPSMELLSRGLIGSHSIIFRPYLTQYGTQLLVQTLVVSRLLLQCNFQCNPEFGSAFDLADGQPKRTHVTLVRKEASVITS